MPLFEVTLPDASTRIMRAHTRKQLRDSLRLQQIAFTRIEQRRRCRMCRKAGVVATVQNTLCQPCWEKLLTLCQETWKDIEMTRQELEDTALSYFVDG